MITVRRRADGAPVPRPQMLARANYTVGMQGERWYYFGAFVDNVRRYPRADDWIEVVW